MGVWELPSSWRNGKIWRNSFCDDFVSSDFTGTVFSRLQTWRSCSDESHGSIPFCSYTFFSHLFFYGLAFRFWLFGLVISLTIFCSQEPYGMIWLAGTVRCLQLIGRYFFYGGIEFQLSGFAFLPPFYLFSKEKKIFMFPLIWNLVILFCVFDVGADTITKTYWLHRCWSIQNVSLKILLTDLIFF